jgi:iodotyrosine deiodinase
MAQPEFVPHADRHDPGEPPLAAARRFREVMRKRRSVRMFSDRPLAREVVEELVRCAATAPSGANLQPWRFVAVADPALKARIRAAAEAEEREFYARRAPKAWLEALAPLGTDEHKEYLEVAPWLVAVFRMTHTDDGRLVYYSEESCGIATGLFLAAAHHAGLATLTHTPSPMKFLAELLGRPAHERAYMLIPLGWPAGDCRVPRHALSRRPLEDTLVVHEAP